MLVVLSLLPLLASWGGGRERCVPTQEATEGIHYQKYAQNLEKYTQNLGYELKVCTVCTKSGMHKSGFWEIEQRSGEREKEEATGCVGDGSKVQKKKEPAHHYHLVPHEQTSCDLLPVFCLPSL